MADGPRKELAGVTLPGQMFNVFTIRDGQIQDGKLARGQGFTSRKEAVSAGVGE